MLRDAFKKHQIGMNTEFRHRGTEPSRIETLSDAVFALAITLVIISAQMPQTFADLKLFLWDIIPFACCIALIMLIWYEHFRFFYRYDFRNVYIVMLNSLLLSVVLIYVYPLKFLTKLLTSRLILGWLDPSMDAVTMQSMLGPMISIDEIGSLMVIYGLGAGTVFLLFALMYRYAMRKADELDLNAIERFDTRQAFVQNLLMASVPLISASIALIFMNFDYVGLYSGLVYFFYWPVMLLFGHISDRKRAKLV